jgi:zinc protease
MIRLFRHLAVVVVVALSGSLALFAQQPAAPTSQAVVIKGRAPVSAELLKVQLPKPVETDLPNGAHLMVLEDHRVPQVVFQILIEGAGGYFDPSDAPGLAAATAAMMREGTTSLTTTQIAEQLERKAASLSVGAGLSSVEAAIGGASLSDGFEDTFALAADVLLHPVFPDEELVRWKDRTRTALVQQRSNPAFLANEMFARVVYGDHPAGRVSHRLDVVDALTRAKLEEFHRSRYVPDRAVIAVAGDITAANARRIVETRLAAWRKANAPALVIRDPAPIGPAKITFVARPNSVQTNIIVATQAIDRVSPDYDQLAVMNSVIGGGPTGRLFVILREEKGYTYGASSGISAGRFRGAWSASTDVRTEVTDDALRDLLAEIARLRNQPVPAAELQDKKRGAIASFARSLESPQTVLGNHITRWTYKLPADYWDRYPERVDAVTQAQVAQMAVKYLDPSRLQIVIVGDPKIGEALKKYGTVETFDPEGRRIGGS